jgi:mono/diheme cytochrome c family protein
MSPRIGWSLAIAVGFSVLPAARASEETTTAQRGERALLGRSFLPGTIPLSSYDNAWRVWSDDAQTPPKDYSNAFMERYGLHPSPYPNGRYPMGLRETKGLLGKGIATDCMICHGGSIAGKSYVGLGNSSLDFEAFVVEMAKAEGGSGKLPFRFCNTRGTSEAGAFAVYLLGFREPDLRLRIKHLDLEIHDDMCEDVPAWWLLKKKKTMYATGTGDARSVRSLMQFMLNPLNFTSTFEREEPTFRDIREYLLTLQPPKYPLPIDAKLAHKGEALFTKTCSKCHGTYGEKWTYPNRVVPLDEIGTDPARFHGLSEKFGNAYAESWFAKEKEGWFGDEYKPIRTSGYQAPPLDGIWATAPYFHNGSAPTVYHVLNSKARPKVFTRSFHTGLDDYDSEKLGWNVKEVDGKLDPVLPAIERRRIYDTTQPGRGNTGHTFGDKFTDDERMAVIEYLKTL